MEDDPRRSTTSALQQRNPEAGAGPTPTPTCWSALLWPRRSPRRAGLARRPRYPRVKKQDTQKVSEPGGLRKVEARSPRLEMRGLAGAEPGPVANTRGPGPDGFPPALAKGSEVFPCAARGLQIPRSKGFFPYPDLTAKGRRGAWAQAKSVCHPGSPKSSARLGLLGLLYSFS